MIRTYQTLITYMNRHFQFYGRHLELKVYQGQGSASEELLGGGQSGANADAIQESQQVGAFADVGTEAPVFAEALAHQGVIATAPIYPSLQFYADNAPYAWGVTPDCTKLVKLVGDFLVKQVIGQKVLVGEYTGQDRHIGLVYPESPAYSGCGDALKAQLASAGQPFADVRQYRLSLDGIPPDSRDIASAFANEGITTVVLLSDPLLPYFMTSTAQQSDWHPEWVQTGIAYMDADFAGQLYQPDQWKHAFGISMNGPTIPARSTYGYAAYRSIDPNTSPVEVTVEGIYYQLYLLATGIHMAGPNLTPQSFGQGLRAYRAAQTLGPVGSWGFPDGQFTAPTDGRIIWWDPNATSNYNGNKGAYADNGQRYPFGGIPAGPPPISLTP